MSETSIAELESAQYSSPETEAVLSKDESKQSSPPEIDVEAMLVASQESDMQVLYELYDDLSTDNDNGDREQAFRQGCQNYIMKNREQPGEDDDLEVIAKQDIEFTSIALRNARIRQVLIENLPENLSSASDKLIQSLVFIISKNIKVQKEPQGSALQAVESPKKEDVLKEIATLPEISLVDNLPNDMVALRDENGRISISIGQISKPDTNFLHIVEEIESRLESPNTDMGGGNIGAAEFQRDQGVEAFFAEKGISREDLLRYKKFRHRDRFALASVYNERQKDPKSGAFESLRLEFNRMIKAEPSDYRISDIIIKTYSAQLEKYYTMWQVLVNSNFNPDDLKTDDEADGGSDSVDSSSSDTEAHSSGGSTEHGKEGGAAKEARTRVGGKGNEPRNVYQALVSIFDSVNAEILEPINLPGAIVDDMSNWKPAA